MKLPRNPKRARRVIDSLRKHVPGTWSYEGPPSFWRHAESGLVVRAYAKLTPQHDSDDESYTIIYVREDTRREVFPSWGNGLEPPWGPPLSDEVPPP